MPDHAPGTANPATTVPSATTETPTEPRQSLSPRVRVVQLVFLALAVVATLGLAWWQWGRWSSGDGSYQNLGYALQWPIFGIFFIFAYRRYMEYERDRAAGNATPAVPEPSPDSAPRAIPDDVLPARASVEDDDPFADDRRRRARESRTTTTPTTRTDRESR